MNKVISILISITIVAGLLSGCGSKATQEENTGGKAADKVEAVEKEETAGRKTVRSKPAESEVKEVEEKSVGNVKINMGTMGGNLSLPASFPKDVVPLAEDANIINVIDNKDSKAVSVTFTTGKSYEEMISFYQKVMKDGSTMMEEKKDEAYILMGEKGKYGVMIAVSLYDGKNVSVALHVNYNE